MFFKIRVFKNFVIFSAKHLCWSLVLINCRPSEIFKNTPYLQNNRGGCFWNKSSESSNCVVPLKMKHCSLMEQCSAPHIQNVLRNFGKFPGNTWQILMDLLFTGIWSSRRKTSRAWFIFQMRFMCLFCGYFLPGRYLLFYGIIWWEILYL